MWDNAALLRSIANALLAFSVLAALYGAVYYTVHLPGLFPLRSMHLGAAPQRVDAQAVLAVARGEVRGNFFTVDIERLRKSLEKLPWVRKVAIRREFPGRLIVRLEEHQALGRWNGTALVNTYGEVFGAESEQALPDFIGSDGSSAKVAQHYAQFGAQLAALNLRIAQLALTPRHAWQLRLDNGLVLELGREQMQQRLARFVTVYPYSLAAMQGAIKYVDLRYRNGFAVGGAITG
ncbi:MAG: cell division protein FtsQ [Gallionellales bacterium RIFCSPLOWO2_12_FULL_59_22]|nr:MAG: cell division protein FtsQ [Gallionellales bacterium RIFCSPLOWO2_02_FULL_59_110]OGT13311.1 MAG: cell division protein FtsQ [Gallionellales bacterium RIFCSPLOWO2_12_FULL_59_22]